MNDAPSIQQAGFGRRFRFLVIFRLAPGFFVGILPGRFFRDYEYDEETMVIRRIAENEYMFLRRIGVPEASVIMDQFGAGDVFGPFEAGK